MVVGDGNTVTNTRAIFFLAPNSSDPLPDCLTGNKDMILDGFRRNPPIMKTHGGCLTIQDID